MQFGLSKDRHKFRCYLMHNTYTTHFAWLPQKMSDSGKRLWLGTYYRKYTAGRRFTTLCFSTSRKTPRSYFTHSTKCLVPRSQMLFIRRG